ncbi:excinuclease ABC subunit UvrC [Aminobacterium sp. UBA4834]|jgi:excinuclease ABC subunit C|uniref:excinuclease ABC subunit UvrC n=2 Tax=Aminobacteriaceae TaxID=3029087 RepID=UPI0025796713|nr:excinuclease ABC subunit UvrC [Aminobacterium sp. UBA4834]
MHNDNSLMVNPKIKNIVKNLPLRPGVYIMRDEEGNVIYVGKAKSLRKRVSSYFRHQGFASPRLRKLVETIADISTIRTETEAEALIVESRLIKKYKPFFNIDLKMNERYPYIKITNERFPRLVITRNKEDDGSIYLGPYISAKDVRVLLRLIERYFPLRSCKAEVRPDKRRRPCLNYALGRCLAPCAGLCGETEYRERVDDIVLLLQGRSSELVERMRKRMELSASDLDFEKAARYRDTIRAIWRLSRQRVPTSLQEDLNAETWDTLNQLQEILKMDTLPWRIDGFDISHMSGRETYGVVVVFEQGVANPSLYRRFKIRTVEGIDDFRSMEETVHRRYQKVLENNEPLPQLILIDGGPVQLEFAKKALSDLALVTIPVISLAKREELIYHSEKELPIRLDWADPVLQLLQRVRDESHRFAIKSHRRGRGVRLTRSRLEDIPGVGKHTAALLLSHFGSMKKIATLSPEELTTVKGIGPVLAKKIVSFFRGEEHEPETEA